MLEKKEGVPNLIQEGRERYTMWLKNKLHEITMRKANMVPAMLTWE